MVSVVVTLFCLLVFNVTDVLKDTTESRTYVKMVNTTRRPEVFEIDARAVLETEQSTGVCETLKSGFLCHFSFDCETYQRFIVGLGGEINTK